MSTHRKPRKAKQTMALVGKAIFHIVLLCVISPAHAKGKGKGSKYDSDLTPVAAPSQPTMYPATVDSHHQPDGNANDEESPTSASQAQGGKPLVANDSTSSGDKSSQSTPGQADGKDTPAVHDSSGSNNPNQAEGGRPTAADDSMSNSDTLSTFDQTDGTDGDKSSQSTPGQADGKDTPAVGDSSGSNPKQAEGGRPTATDDSMSNIDTSSTFDQTDGTDTYDVSAGDSSEARPGQVESGIPPAEYDSTSNGDASSEIFPSQDEVENTPAEYDSPGYGGVSSETTPSQVEAGNPPAENDLTGHGDESGDASSAINPGQTAEKDTLVDNDLLEATPIEAEIGNPSAETESMSNVGASSQSTTDQVDAKDADAAAFDNVFETAPGQDIEEDSTSDASSETVLNQEESIENMGEGDLTSGVDVSSEFASGVVEESSTEEEKESNSDANLSSELPPDSTAEVTSPDLPTDGNSSSYASPTHSDTTRGDELGTSANDAREKEVNLPAFIVNLFLSDVETRLLIAAHLVTELGDFNNISLLSHFLVEHLSTQLTRDYKGLKYVALEDVSADFIEKAYKGKYVATIRANVTGAAIFDAVHGSTAPSTSQLAAPILGAFNDADKKPTLLGKLHGSEDVMLSKVFDVSAELTPGSGARAHNGALQIQDVISPVVANVSDANTAGATVGGIIAFIALLLLIRKSVHMYKADRIEKRSFDDDNISDSLDKKSCSPSLSGSVTEDPTFVSDGSRAGGTLSVMTSNVSASMSSPLPLSPVIENGPIRLSSSPLKRIKALEQFDNEEMEAGQGPYDLSAIVPSLPIITLNSSVEKRKHVTSQGELAVHSVQNGGAPGGINEGPQLLLEESPQSYRSMQEEVGSAVVERADDSPMFDASKRIGIVPFSEQQKHSTAEGGIMGTSGDEPTPTANNTSQRIGIVPFSEQKKKDAELSAKESSFPHEPPELPMDNSDDGMDGDEEGRWHGHDAYTSAVASLSPPLKGVQQQKHSAAEGGIMGTSGDGPTPTANNTSTSKRIGIVPFSEQKHNNAELSATKNSSYHEQVEVLTDNPNNAMDGGGEGRWHGQDAYTSGGGSLSPPLKNVVDNEGATGAALHQRILSPVENPKHDDTIACAFDMSAFVSSSPDVFLREGDSFRQQSQSPMHNANELLLTQQESQQARDESKQTKTGKKTASFLSPPAKTLEEMIAKANKVESRARSSRKKIVQKRAYIGAN